MNRVCSDLESTSSHTAQRLLAIWTYLNDRYFSRRLLPIEIRWSSRLTSSAGMFVSRVGPRFPDRDAGRRVIRLSAPLLLQQHEQEIISTLAHEMIHQWQYDVLKRRPSHGPDFVRKMKEMNRHGLGITLCHTLEDAVQALTKYAWRCAECGRLYHRQRRTIRPRRHRCGHCRGPLHELSFAHVNRQREKFSSGRRTRTSAGAKAVQLELPFAGP